METIIPESSPLAAYLEGEGQRTDNDGHEPWITATPPSEPNSPARSSAPSVAESRTTNDDAVFASSFAPKRPTVGRSIRHRLPQPLKLKIPSEGPVARMHEVCSRAVNSRLGRADNARFLEHFRYILVASQLLSENQGFVPPKPMQTSADGTNEPLNEYKATATSVTGAFLTATTSFAVVWLIHWARAGRARGFSTGRALIVLSVLIAAAMVLYAWARRRWLQNLRQNAVNSASVLVTNLQAFEASTSAALILVQEVELVSKGYRIGTPLPPISRMDDDGQGRRCARIRRCLKGAFAASIPPFLDACSDLRDLISEDDLDKYLDVYEITYQDITEAYQGFSTSEFEDPESLKALRILQARLNILRRVALCALLSMEADGARPDFDRWKTAVDTMERLAAVSGDWAEKMNKLLDEEQTFVLPTPATPHRARDPERQKFRAQIQKLSALSSGIRGLQAKMQILREESIKSIDEADDLSDLGPRLMVQYDAIGQDLRALVQAWESGKASLVLNIDRRESRRISLASSGLRSPVPSLGGLTAVDESVGGTPSDALRALNGEAPLHNRFSFASSDSPIAGSNSDEEIFEAIANPKTRFSLTREQRIARLKEESERMASFKERREREGSMLKELESVMAKRPAYAHRKRNTIAIPGPMPPLPGSRNYSSNF
ncbi:hypothetical protein, variant [Verruconis gallopava]|uniref:Vezatin n=1 Tax=Verruconis gallopava TaxID=253628 RepID=A0A0D2B8X0_9PEZI|nr:hypothetical protein, variant [Verruconis gallopava]KIW07704.1 hypothetical protein, variant [Verruconis gallopava]